MAKTKPKTDDPGERALEIKFNMPDSIVTRFATNMTVQSLESEFKVSFFELVPEIYFPGQGEPPKEIKAECVSSVIISADRMEKFIEAMQFKLDQYKELKKK